MRKIMSIIAVAIALLGTANVALAQVNADFGANTGSAANRAAHTHGGEYLGRE
jgi:hypothetical protein